MSQPPAVPSTTDGPLPVSPRQAEALAAGTLPPVEEVRPGTWTIAIPFRTGAADATLSYAVEGSDGSVTLIDPGWATAEGLSPLDAGLRSFGKALDDVALVAVTHLHLDHLGAAEAVRRASGAAVALHGEELRAIEEQDADRALDERDIASWGLPDDLVDGVRRAWGRGRSLPAVGAEHVTVDHRLADGDRLPVPGRDLRVLHTPGHTTGHVCLVDEADGLLFTGDHVLPRINPGIGLGGRPRSNPLTAYLASLRRLDGLGHLEVCPGHEYRFADVTGRAATLVAHRAERSAVIAGVLDALDRPTLYEVASRVPFRGGIESMTGYLLASALAQTGFHVDALGRAAEVRSAG